MLFNFLILSINITPLYSWSSSIFKLYYFMKNQSNIDQLWRISWLLLFCIKFTLYLRYSRSMRTTVSTCHSLSKLLRKIPPYVSLSLYLLQHSILLFYLLVCYCQVLVGKILSFSYMPIFPYY